MDTQTTIQKRSFKKEYSSQAPGSRTSD